MTLVRRALLPAGAATIVFVCWLLADVGNAAGYVIGYGLVAAAFIGLGLLAWERSPGDRVGRLLVAIGFAWLLPPLRYSDVSLLWTVGFLLLPTLHVALLVHLLFAYPGGRVESRLEQAVIAWAYLDATLGTLLVAFFQRDPGAAGFAGFPSNLVLIDGDVATWRALTDAQGLARNALAFALLALVARRLLRASRRARVRLGPVLFAGLVAALLFSTGYTTLGLAGRFAPEWLQDWRDVRWIVLIAYALIPIGFSIGLLGERLARSAVADLIIELERTPSWAGLRTALVRALHDPSLQLVRWSSSRERFEHDDGTPAAVPPMGSGRAHAMLEHEGRPVAALVYDAEVADDARVVEAAVAAVRLALDKERLNDRLRAQLGEVRASRARIVEAGDAERRRLERNVHDGAQQQLVALSVLLAMARRNAVGDLAGRLEEAAGLTATALGELRTLARGLHPAILAEEGLDGALEQLADASPVPVRVVALPGGRLPETVEVAAYFAVSEALANVAKYAGASEATVRAERQDGHLLVEVADDGAGGADAARGSGLRGLSDRIAALDGRLEVDSPPGAGTRVHVELPCA